MVTPSRMPRSLASLIWAKLAVSMKNFMDTKLGFLLEGLGCIDTHFLHLFGCFFRFFCCDRSEQLMVVCKNN